METRNNNHLLIIADASGLVSVAIATDANHQNAVAAATDLANQHSLVLQP